MKHTATDGVSMNLEQCTTYLFQGLGRPHIYLQRHDGTPYHEVLLHACLYNPCYDRATCISRCTYFHELMQLTNTVTMFRQPILDALAEPDEEMDVEQLFDFALLYARAGDPYARQVMYEQCAEQTQDSEYIGTDQLIDLDGVEALLFIANSLGERALSDDDFSDNDHLLQHLANNGIHADIEELREMARGRYPFAHVYFDLIAEYMQEGQQHKPRTRMGGKTYTQIKEQLTQSDKRPSRIQLAEWSAKASEEDLQRAAHDLLQQTDPQVLGNYFALFDKQAFPLGFEPLLPFVQHKDKRIVRGAIQSIAQFQHKAIRTLAFELVEAKYHLENALDLFICNYREGDEHYFQQLLEETTDTDTIHTVGFSMSDIFKQNPTANATPIFIDLYERGPCMLCREDFVQRLIDTQTLPSYIAHEAQYDAEESIRDMVKAYCAK